MLKSKVCHGISVCLLGSAHAQKLRAGSALPGPYGQAGLSPLLRPALSGPLRADPVYYQIAHGLQTDADSTGGFAFYFFTALES